MSAGNDTTFMAFMQTLGDPTNDCSIETSENEARDIPIGALPVATPIDEPPSTTLVALLGAMDLCLHAGEPFEGKFPTHPKPSQEWWKALREHLDALWPRLLIAVDTEMAMR